MNIKDLLKIKIVKSIKLLSTAGKKIKETIFTFFDHAYYSSAFLIYSSSGLLIYFTPVDSD